MIDYLNAVDTLVVVVVVHGVVGRQEDPFVVGHRGSALGWGGRHRDTGVVRVCFCVPRPHSFCWGLRRPQTAPRQELKSEPGGQMAVVFYCFDRRKSCVAVVFDTALN